jgi:hypothetical protein
MGILGGLLWQVQRRRRQRCREARRRLTAPPVESVLDLKRQGGSGPALLEGLLGVPGVRLRVGQLVEQEDVLTPRQ